VAAFIREQLGLQPELVEGDRGEFTVWVGDQMVAKKGWVRFPQDQNVLSAVQQALMGSRAGGRRWLFAPHCVASLV
jgi:hypothetical protein